MTFRRLFLFAMLWLTSYHSAFACSVCFDAKDGTRGAFLWTTALLSLVPLAMIAGGIFTLKHYSSKKAVQSES